MSALSIETDGGGARPDSLKRLSLHSMCALARACVAIARLICALCLSWPADRFGSGTARHLFCSRCGISPFYRPRSNPDGWGVTLQCVDAGTIASVEVRPFDGLNWEECIDGAGAAIKAFSKPPGAADAPTDLVEAHPPQPTSWLWLLLEALVTILLPLAVALTVVRTGKMPGKPATA